MKILVKIKIKFCWILLLHIYKLYKMMNQGVTVTVGQTPSQQGIVVQHPSYYVRPPMGIEFLVPLNGVFVKQEIEILEMLLTTETNNRYSLFNANGQLIYRALENSDYWNLNCSCTCGTSRPFTLLMFDANNTCITFESQPASGLCQEVTCLDPAGQVLGYVSQTESGCTSAKFEIQDAMRVPYFIVSGGTCGSCGDVPFPIFLMDGQTQVGEICKKWSGYIIESRTDADNFMVTFPVDLDARLKAVLIGACFQIDFMFFERKQGSAD